VPRATQAEREVPFTEALHALVDEHRVLGEISDEDIIACLATEAASFAKMKRGKTRQQSVDGLDSRTAAFSTFVMAWAKNG
jgi:hypothetical protein